MDNVNMFIKPIIMKKNNRFNFKAWLEYRKIIKYCNNNSPTFDQMVLISDFLDILRYSYMYGNNEEFHLFTGTLPKGYYKNTACSFFYKDDNCKIGFVLIRDTKEINIEIERKCQNNKPEKERISFIDGEYSFTDVYDQEKFLYITSCMMESLKELIMYYYNNKKF